MSLSSAVIDLIDVRKAFGGVKAVDGVSLGVQGNEFLALLGASGCGKTTLLRLIAGLERADAGQILIAGQDMTSSPPHVRPVNLMFQSYALFPHMSVRDNVAFGLKQDGLHGAELSARIGEALALVEMEGLGARRPEQLSGGQQQRVALARCIAKRPRALLLDEPMAALDRALRERTRLELINLRRRLGISFVVVTHDQEDAMTMADRVAVMDKGKIIQLGTPRELYDKPGSRLVAAFFGESNIWDGRVAPDGRRVECPVLGMALKTNVALPHVAEAVTVSVRPERISLDPTPLPDDNALADATIEDVVYLGTVSTYLVRVPHGALIRVTRQNGSQPPLARGSRVSVTWPADAVVVLTS
ncbi:MAG: ABC transporter ATP-binding protein [Rhodospirillaceae bacterium]|nr:ABC transporter ATP-binding protein [Rhodospirillaceae bacterium]